MNWVPLFFIDAVCQQLKIEAFQEVSQLSGDWSIYGAEHHKERRELDFWCMMVGQDISYSLKGDKYGIHTVMLASDLNLEFDRIITIRLVTSASTNKSRSSLDEPTKERRTHVSLDELERDVLPSVASLVANCWWCYLKPGFSAQNRIFFKAFKNCPGFERIHFREQGQESRDFLARQVELGNLQSLTLFEHEFMKCPEPEKLAETLKTFVKSARFHVLTYNGAPPNDFDLIELFLGRAFAGELQPRALISIDRMTSEKIQKIGSLRSECRQDSKEIAWQIPNSNRRITQKYSRGTLCMEVQ